MTNGSKRTVLYADDDADDRMFMRDAMGDAGIDCDLRFATDGRDLLDYLRNTGKYAAEKAPRPDVILLDLNMPGVDGFEALGQIKSDPSLWYIPVIVFTSSKAEVDIFKAYKSGAAAFVAKPNTYDGLIAAVKAFRQWWLDHVRYVTDFQAAGSPIGS